jgi:hypothetical protein
MIVYLKKRMKKSFNTVDWIKVLTRRAEMSFNAGELVELTNIPNNAMYMKSQTQPYSVGDMMTVVEFYPANKRVKQDYVVVTPGYMNGAWTCPVTGKVYTGDMTFIEAVNLKRVNLTLGSNAFEDCSGPQCKGTSEPKGCSCDIMSLMARGCKCGWLEVEKNKK